MWGHYARTFKGQVQLRWTKGLRELLGLGDVVKDAVVAAAVDRFEVLLARLQRSDWRRVLANEARGALQQIAATGDRERLWAFLRALPGGSDEKAAPRAPSVSSGASDWCWGAEDILALAGAPA